jgi:putative drug exporter of the RND superfamily
MPGIAKGGMSVFKKYASWVFRLRWVIVPIWLVVMALAIALLPNLQAVVARQNTTYLPDTNSVIQAQKLANQVDPGKNAKTTAVIAIQRRSGLTDADVQYFENGLQYLEQHKSAYGIVTVTDKRNTDASLASKFRSGDNTTELGTVGFSHGVGDPELPDDLAKVKQAFSTPPAGAHVYVTGDAPIQEEDIQISQQGADKTTVVTIVLVLVILLLVFRSILAPVLTLAAIGLSFVLSSSIVAGFAKLGLPVSTFTQTFLIAVLFGAGTDYTIILINRFREELSRHGGDKQAALIAAFQGVGKTVVFSSLTVIVSFAALGFANFGLYKSAVGVSIGVTITLVTCLAFIPALMGILGPVLYWPRKPVGGHAHGDSRVWRATALVSTRWPWRTILVLLVVLLPVALLFGSDRSFNPMSDIPQAPAVKGFQAVAQAFGPGEALPSTIVLHTDGNLRSSDGLATIQKLSTAMANVPGVKEVDSATQPIGKKITDFELSTQNQKAADGLHKVSNGLTTLSSQLLQSAQQAQDGISGAKSLAQGAQQVHDGLRSVNQGLSQLAGSANQLNRGASQLSSGLSLAAVGANSVAGGAESLAASQRELSDLASQLNSGLQAWAAKHPQDAADPSFQKLLGLASAQQSGSQQAASGAVTVAGGAQALAQSIGKLQQGGEALNHGLGQLSQGAMQLSQGTAKLADGSAQVSNGVAKLPQSLQQTASGLQAAGQGARQLKDGVSQVRQYLSATKSAETAGDPGFHVPESAVTSNADLRKAMDAYISPDGHIAKFTVILSQNPYSAEAMANLANIRTAAETALQSSPIHTGTVLAGGTTAVQEALNEISAKDFTRTMVIVLAAIFLLLVAMLRSLIAPLYIIASLAGTYTVTMGCLQTIVLHVLHKPGVSWAVPFFVFLLLVALGVDYSMFLMARFEEEYLRGMSPSDAIREAMSKMGKVIFSAAAIMAGTFGSMIVAGVESLTEIGLSVVMGLILYAAVFLAFFIPASVRVVGRGHGWPFRFEKTVAKHFRRPAEE